MKEFVNKLYQELIEDIGEFSEMGMGPMQRLSGALRTTREALIRLRKQVVSEGFTDEKEEISFFKYDKPKFVAEQIYLTELTLALLGKPGNDDELLKIYYEDELKRLRLFINRFGFLYQCYQMDVPDLDVVLFLRGAGPSGLVLPEQTVHDSEFATAGDHLWAKFIAYDRLREWLESEIRGLAGGTGGPAPGGDGGTVLKWTGNTVNLAELAYGIWLTGQVNHGHVSVSEIVAWLERHFQVKIGDAHRRWQSIAARKRVAPFQFIDEMKVSLVKRLEDEWAK